MSKQNKYIDIKEFREGGYLQEVNRTFLHPLGFALEIIVDDDGEEHIGGILDCRENGIYYGLHDSDKKRQNKFLKNAIGIKNKLDARSIIRQKELGFIVEPIPMITIEKDNTNE